MDARLKRIGKANFDHAKKQIQQYTVRCVNVLQDALRLAEEYTGDNRLWFGDVSDAPLAKEGYTIDDIYVNCNTLWVSMSGEYDNGMMPIENMDIWYLIELAEFVRDHIDEFIEEWENSEV